MVLPSRPLVALLSAEAISLLGSQMTFLALLPFALVALRGGRQRAALPSKPPERTFR